MAYTLRISIPFDSGSLYTAGFPTFMGRLTSGGTVNSALSTTSPSLSITFPSISNPPAPGSRILVTDPSGPGDFFRSGPLPAWPKQPAAEIMVETGVRPMSWAEIEGSFHLPIGFDIPQAALAGLLTGLQFIPFRMDINSLNLSSSPTRGAVRAQFRGTLGFTSLAVPFVPPVPRRTNMSGSVDLALAPSGDDVATKNLLTIRASNLAITITADVTTLLSTSLIHTIAPLLTGALSAPLTEKVNKALQPVIDTARAAGPGFSAAATLSIQRLSVLNSGLSIRAVLAEVIPPMSSVISTRQPRDPDDGPLRGDQHRR